MSETQNYTLSPFVFKVESIDRTRLKVGTKEGGHATVQLNPSVFLFNYSSSSIIRGKAMLNGWAENKTPRVHVCYPKIGKGFRWTFYAGEQSAQLLCITMTVPKWYKVKRREKSMSHSGAFHTSVTHER